MIVVKARKDTGRHLTTCDMRIGSVFWLNGVLCMKIQHCSNIEVLSLENNTTQSLASSDFVREVIPAKVLLVEKGADLEEVRKALEAL